MLLLLQLEHALRRTVAGAFGSAPQGRFPSHGRPLRALERSTLRVPPAHHALPKAGHEYQATAPALPSPRVTHLVEKSFAYKNSGGKRDERRRGEKNKMERKMALFF